MPHLQTIGGIAAFANVFVALATLATAFLLIGVAAIADPTQLAEMAVNNPTPLLIQDGLKIASAVISIVLILAVANYLRHERSALLFVASGFGFLSVLCLVGNAALSLYAIAQASAAGQVSLPSQQLNMMIGSLALGAIVLDGLWLLLVSWIALKHQQLPKRLCYLGFGMGALSLVPPLGIIVLLLGIVWSIWIGRVFLQSVEP
ncbi:hypothetical protein [Vacuolonema iberomarrocanum]|uniref:hypothetical protein n=1 Tax=Vacuolonema iberomarrocanum TaxID=3454632 RepID=UPI0019F27F6C|nr:hypothetical protein [filamentous cyanobacterium LEGE 07170]